MKNIFLSMCFFYLVSCNIYESLTSTVRLKKASSPVSEKDKTLYAMGQMYARRIEHLKLSEPELDLMIQGLVDGNLRKESQVDLAIFDPEVQKFVQQRIHSIAEIEKQRGVAYIDDFVKKGAVKTASGLAYKIISAGNNQRAKDTDSVELNFEGKTVDGVIFESTEGKTPQSVSLSQVILGLKEAVKLIGEGGKIEVAIPATLAYGDEGAPPKITGGETLIFHITLLKIIP